MSLHEKELEKYQKIWKFSEYRAWSPGENACDLFLNNLAWRRGDSLIDLGCGTGRAGAFLATKGLNVMLLDFCFEAIDVKNLPIVVANLWDLSAIATFDWLFCVDVLEHIPEEKIEDTLKGMASICNKGGYLQIALFHDGCGARIGETLHMTVKPMEWWLAAILMHFDVTVVGDDKDVRGNNGYAKFAVRAR